VQSETRGKFARPPPQFSASTGPVAAATLPPSPTPMDAVPAAPSPAARRRRRWLVAGGVVLALCALFAVWATDDNPPDVSDLRPLPRQLPDAQNAWLQLSKAATMLTWDRARDAGDGLIFMKLLAGDARDDATVAAWLAPENSVWPLFEQAAALPSGQAPVADDLESFLLAQKAPRSAHQINDLLDLSIVRAWSLFHSGQPDTGVDALLTTLRAVKLLEESRGGLDSVWTLTRRRQANKALAAMSQHQEVSSVALRRALTTLVQTRPDPREFALNLRVMLRENFLKLDALERGQESAVFGPGPRPTILSHGVNWPLLFKPHRTQWLLADNLRGSLRLLDADRKKIIAWQADERARMIGVDWRTLNPDNFFGRLLLLGDLVPASHLLRFRVRELAEISATETVLALRLHYMEHGALPSKLDELVPAYLPSVPLDYFDREPIRYSPAHFAVWSVGWNNFKVTSPDPDEDDTDGEIYFRLDFAAPPRLVPPAENPSLP